MFKSEGNFLFERIEEKVSGKGNPFRLAHVIDIDNYERLEFFVGDNSKINATEGSKCTVILKGVKRGYNTNFELVSLTSKAG